MMLMLMMVMVMVMMMMGGDCLDDCLSASAGVTIRSRLLPAVGWCLVGFCPGILDILDTQIHSV